MSLVLDLSRQAYLAYHLDRLVVEDQENLVELQMKDPTEAQQ